MLTKAFREEIEIFEKEIVDNLNKTLCSNKKEVQAISSLIEHTFDFSKAEHNGNSYKEPGDITLYQNNGEKIFLELKKIQNGRGTLANITQDAFTKYKVFNGISWSNFRKNTGFQDKILTIILSYDPTFEFTTQAEFQKKVRLIKDNPNFLLFRKQIEELARQDKIDYLNYLQTLPLNIDFLQIFTRNMFNGTHTIGNYSFDILEKDDSILYTCYYLTKTDFCYIENEVNNIENLDIKFLKDTTGFLITTNNKPLIRVAFHWKNIFQGIATPCLNIFDVRGKDINA